MAGVWCQVSLFLLTFLSIPIMISYLCTGIALTAMGADETLIPAASYFAFVLTAAIPARVMSR